MRKRILFISDHGDPLAFLGGEQAGGQNNYVKQLALALEKQGNRVDVVTHWVNSTDPQIQTFGKACRVIRIAAGRQGYVSKDKMYQLLPAFYEEMVRTIDLASYDLVHTHYWLSGFLGIQVKANYEKPWIHTNHSLGIVKEQATGQRNTTRIETEKLILSTADRVVTNTKTESNVIERFVDNPSPMTVIGIGVDRIFKPLRIEEQRVEHPYFAFAGRLEETKGIYTLLHAFRRLVERNEISASMKLVVAGGDQDSVDASSKLPKDSTLQQIIKGMEDRFDFIGAQSQRQLASLFNGAEATIVPSYYESFGMVAAEAQACGCPVIATNVGGLSEVVKDQLTGLHIKGNDAKGLVGAMKQLLANPSFTKRLGMTAAAFANSKFRWSTLSKKMNQLYEVTINEHQNTHNNQQISQVL